MRKRWLKSTVVLGYLLHLIFAMFFGLEQNLETSVFASLDVQSEMDAMLGNLSAELEERVLVSTGELIIADEIQEMIPTLSDSHEVAADEVLIDEGFNTKIQVDLLTANNFVRNDGTYAFVDDDALIGEGDVDLSFSDGKFLNDIVMKSSSDIKSKSSSNSNSGNFSDKHIFVVLPEGAQAFDGEGNPYNKKIIAPKIEDKEIFVNGDNYQLVFSIGGDQHLYFEYPDGSSAYADFYVSVDETVLEQDFPVYFSQDGEGRDCLDEAGIVPFMGDDFLTFQADHFTYFAIGAEEGSFLINNGDLSTSTTGVVLYNNVQNISQMKFGNTTGEVIAASFETFATTKSRYLTTGDGTKFVYAIFEDISGNTGLVMDSIILDEEDNVSWVDYSVLPTQDGLALWFDADDMSTIETGAGNAISGRQDKAGSNYDAVQSISANRPTYTTGSIKTKVAVSFDGTNDYLALKDINYQGTSALSGLFACVVFRTDFVGGGYNRNWAFLDFDRSDFFDFYIRGDDGRLGFSTHGSSTVDNYGSTAYNDDAPHIACISYNNSIVNDTQIIVDGNIEFNQSTFSLGQYLGKASTRYGFLGDGSEASSFDSNRNNIYYDGYMAEVIYYEQSISTGDQKELQCYLSDKWGINLNFDCDNNLTGIYVIYNPDGPTVTSGNVIVSLTGYNASVVEILNNSGSDQYTFTENGSFIFLYEDDAGNMGSTVATVDWIQSTVPDDLIVARKISNVGPMERKSVNFEKTYTEVPFVFVTPVTENTTDTYPIPLVRNITTGGFQITSCVEQGNSVCSTTANAEDFHYFVVDSGDVSGLSWIDIDVVSTATNGSDTAVSFNKIFSNTPYVWATPQTYNQGGNNGMVAWVDDGTLSTSSMDLIGCRHNGNGNGCTAGTNESVAYLAIDVQNANITGFSYGTKSISNSTWTSTSFGTNYGEARIMVTQNSDNGAQDPQYAWAKNITSNSASIRYCEQDAAGVCDGHAAEDVMWFALEGDVPPTAEVVYNITGTTTQNVIATLTGESETITIINNSGNRNYTFIENGSFIYQFKDASNNINTVTAEVSWIDKSLPSGEITYSAELFEEDKINNDGTIETGIVLNLSGDEFVPSVSGYVSFNNVPIGLTGIVSYISGTQINIFLTGVASGHLNSDDVSNFGIIFATGAFDINAPNNVYNSVRSNIEIDFYDPFATGGFYPGDDTLLDADTEPANGCDEGVCQEGNYGGLGYMGASDFGSVSLIRFDLTSIPTGSVIVSAYLDLTIMAIGSLGTGFDLTKIINNPGWIEGVGDQGGAAVEEALVGEPNYKQRKRTQENWNNGSPGFVSGSDYEGTNLLDDSYFDTLGDETKSFDFNVDGIDVLQDWLDSPDTNEGFAFGHANTDWTIIYSKEEVIVGYRPQIFLNYILDIVNPEIIALSPNDNQTGVVLDTSLIIEFDEHIHAVSGYNIIVKRSIDDSVFETIDVGSGQVVVSDDTVNITLSSDLENNTGYYVQIDSGAFVDRASNPFTGILDTTTWNFVTLDANSVPTVTGATYTGITQTTGTLGGEITATGSSTVTERGIYRDITDGFNPVDGTKVSETGSWDTLGSFSVPVTGLPAGLRVYYRAFAINGAGAGYSTQDTFLTKPGDPIANAASSVSNRSAVANWSTVTGADSYELYVATDSGFASLVTNYAPKVGLVSDSYAVESIDPETTYYYRLIAKNNAGFSFASNTILFTTTYLPFPVMHLKLEETGGAVAVDSAGTHNGILDGGISFSQPGVDNNAYCLDGIDAKITTVDFSYGPDFAVHFWFKDTANVGTEYLFSHGGTLDSNSVNVFLDGGDSTLKTQVNGQTLFTVSGQDYSDLLDGEWHMYTLVVDDNFAAGGQKKIAIYLDGQQRAVDTSLSAGVYNPTPNITMGRRSIDTTATYFSGCLDDIRIYNQDLFDYEVEDIFDTFVTDLAAPYVVSTIPTSGEVDVSIGQVIEIEFSKAMDHATVEATGVVTLSPNISGISYSRNANTLLISHDDFAYSTGYTITISTGAQDLSGTAMESPYVSSFTTQNNVYLEYLPTVFEEVNQNDGSIKNVITITLTGDTFSAFVVSSGYVVASNVPNGLTGVFVRDSATQITFSLTGYSTSHDDIHDVDNLTVTFGDDAFVLYTATGVSSSTKSTLYIDFNDPNSMSFYPIRDTTLDILNKDYNYGASTVHFIGDGSFVLIDFDLTALPVGATVNSATLTFTKLDGAGADFFIGHLINNSGWVEGTKLGSTASNGESTYNQMLHNQTNRSGGSAGLVSGTDYDATYLVDTVGFSGNETRVFILNSAGIETLSGWLADPDSNEGFALYGGSERFEIGAKDNAEESFRPKLLISYTLSADETAPIITGVVTSPTLPIYSSGNDIDIDVSMESDEYPLYVTFNLYSSTGLLVSSSGEYIVNSSGDWPVVYPFLATGLDDGTYSLYYSVDDSVDNTTTGYIGDIILDTTAPTAYAEYVPMSGDYVSGSVVATLTGFSETGVVITNNSGSAEYLFTTNGSFTFEFIDLAGNTGSYTAIVDWIITEPLAIGVDSGVLFSQSIVTSTSSQIVEQQLSGYLRVNDPIGADNGRYTTLSITDLTGSIDSISKSNISIQASGVDLLSGTANTGVVVDTTLTSYQIFSGILTYIKRDTAANNLIKGKYGNKPWLKIAVPAYQKAEEYQATITYTLYEN